MFTKFLSTWLFHCPRTTYLLITRVYLSIQLIPVEAREMELEYFSTLKIRGDVSIVREDVFEHPGEPKSIIVLIMGPTGAGKSSFIESIAGHTFGISKDQLEGYTQTVTSYKLVNAVYEHKHRSHQGAMPIYLIDTPGFCDNKMSEMEIIEKVRMWMGKYGYVKRLFFAPNAFIHHIIYLQPITDTRLSGHKKRLIEMFKLLIGGPEAGWHVTIATTMWDTIATWNEKGRARAESNFKQLSTEDYVTQGTLLTRFTNTRSSSITILGKGLSLFTSDVRFYEALRPTYPPESATLSCSTSALTSKRRRTPKPLIKTEIARHLHTDLLDRIEALKQQKQNLIYELHEIKVKDYETEAKVIGVHRDGDGCASIEHTDIKCQCPTTHIDEADSTQEVVKILEEQVQNTDILLTRLTSQLERFCTAKDSENNVAGHGSLKDRDIQVNEGFLGVLSLKLKSWFTFNV
ncbi:hypothetical protein CVT24_003907 [Panaeolus cyanescens]|uniref:G domain-containing protein n=1 Tax=Panaeolus cyanescens TaxID=181874 RepID=A0A409VVB2_9AGAR|nr:hypothetical protein CVT24_003907 [Panaeolus cyanescens]